MLLYFMLPSSTIPSSITPQNLQNRLLLAMACWNNLLSSHQLTKTCLKSFFDSVCNKNMIWPFLHKRLQLFCSMLVVLLLSWYCRTGPCIGFPDCPTTMFLNHECIGSFLPININSVSIELPVGVFSFRHTQNRSKSYIGLKSDGRQRCQHKLIACLCKYSITNSK